MVIHLVVFCVGLVSLCRSEVLVLGGQGLSGSATVEALLSHGYPVVALNDGKNYFDYESHIAHRIHNVGCRRRATPLKDCFELQQFLKGDNKISAVVDFTSSTGELMEDALDTLSGLNPDVYIFVSAGAIYDVVLESDQPLKESDSVRPSGSKRSFYASNNEFGDKMLSSEETLIARGVPYVILRAADLVGPRDTTHRWWQYQLWAEHFTTIGQGFPIPNELSAVPFSLSTGDDVAQAVVKVLQRKKINSVYNIAMEKTFTLPNLLLELCTHLNKEKECYANYNDDIESYYLYPSSHQGILSVEKAKSELGFEPSLWQSVLTTTVEFYRTGKALFSNEKDIVLGRLNKNIVPYLRLEALGSEINSDIEQLKSSLSEEVVAKPHHHVSDEL